MKKIQYSLLMIIPLFFISCTSTLRLYPITRLDIEVDNPLKKDTILIYGNISISDSSSINITHNYEGKYVLNYKTYEKWETIYFDNSIRIIKKTIFN